jgi:hypothetical protein
VFIFIEYGISAINNLTYSAVNRLVIVGSRSDSSAFIVVFNYDF